jgi:hypothetical protein
MVHMTESGRVIYQIVFGLYQSFSILEPKMKKCCKNVALLKFDPSNKLDKTVRQNQAKVLSELKKVQADPFRINNKKKIFKNDNCNIM